MHLEILRINVGTIFRIYKSYIDDYHEWGEIIVVLSYPKTLVFNNYFCNIVLVVVCLYIYAYYTSMWIYIRYDDSIYKY